MRTWLYVLSWANFKWHHATKECDGFISKRYQLCWLLPIRSMVPLRICFLHVCLLLLNFLFSGSCRATYGLPDKAPILPGNEAVAQCTKEFSDISPFSGGNIAFSTLEQRPSAHAFEDSEVLQVSEILKPMQRNKMIKTNRQGPEATQQIEISYQHKLINRLNTKKPENCIRLQRVVLTAYVYLLCPYILVYPSILLCRCVRSHSKTTIQSHLLPGLGHGIVNQDRVQPHEHIRRRSVRWSRGQALVLLCSLRFRCRWKVCNNTKFSVDHLIKQKKQYFLYCCHRNTIHSRAALFSHLQSLSALNPSEFS